ncbi:polysaccharide biosynthesis tyrosine autokinase [Cryobacterium sp. MLB-32]|uniref:polysaccharide biosynthesis tyrosine autokinase n=1 Tax=Cryobacterium sp. MLB-32 TaxID=1529318 RepID=UPI0018CE3E05|nr:polysaccharide biosynthesis tyrosine autokinase [Cryobacterium sp. MLB-32]
MEPIEYLRTIGRRWVVIVLLGALGLGAAWAYASSVPPLYKSTSSVFVSSDRGETTSELVQGSTFSQNLVQSYAQLATMPAVLDPVIEKLNLDTTAPELASSIVAATPLNTVIIEITASSESPTRAAATADAVTTSLATTVQKLAPKGPNNTPSITLSTVSTAQVPTIPYAPNTRLLLITGLGAGLALGIVYALARELLDTRLHGEKSILRVTDAPVLGKIGEKRRSDPDGLVMRVMPRSLLAEGYRRIRTNLEFVDVDNRPRCVVVTSPMVADGKSTSALNLALAMAERAPRVLLIDADLRRPSVAGMCDIEGEVGLTTVLVGAVALEDAITLWGGVLYVLPSGAVPPNPGQLLGATAMSDLILRLRGEYDFIVIDSPPLLPASDALGLAHLADGAIVVARDKSTRRAQLAATIESLDAVNARLLGIVLNRIQERHSDAYNYVETAQVVKARLAASSAAAAKAGNSNPDGRSTETSRTA